MPEISLEKFKDIENRSDKQNRNMTVVVTISGGGHRAGNFGVGALTALENIKCNNKTYDALKEVDYFSTVSGGGFAAGAYIASLYDHKANERYSFSKKVDKKSSATPDENFPIILAVAGATRKRDISFARATWAI